jgi:hypothetical protein
MTAMSRPPHAAPATTSATPTRSDQPDHTEATPGRKSALRPPSNSATRLCLSCRQSFTIAAQRLRHRPASYCSRGCYYASRKRYPVMRCQTCGCPFQPRGDNPSPRFCSRPCVKSGPPIRTAEDRFWVHVVCDLASGCWVWSGSRLPAGYGTISIRTGLGAKRQERTHRFSYELHFGPIGAGLIVCHRCDNPPCVRPDHLFLGTNLDNMRDAMTKGRHVAARARLMPLPTTRTKMVQGG